MSQTLSVAIVGAGFFSQFHYEAWTRLERVNLVACCNRNKDKAQTMANTYNIANVYSDLNALLDNTKIDVLDIVTPPETHLNAVRIAASKGIDVVCQKPFGVDIKEAQEMVAIAKKAGISLIIHENFRFMPWYRKVKQVINEGSLGNILNAQYNLRPGDGQGNDAYMARQPYFQKMEKFLIHETGIHFVDTFRFLFGEIKSVYADLRKCNAVISGEDSGQVIFEMTDTLRLLLDGNRLLDHATTNTRRTMGELRVEGTQGSLRLDGEAKIWFRTFGELEEKELKYTWNDFGFGGDCVFNLCQHISQHYLNNVPVENTGEQYLTNIEIENAIYLSNAQGKKIACS